MEENKIEHPLSETDSNVNDIEGINTENTDQTANEVESTNTNDNITDKDSNVKENLSLKAQEMIDLLSDTNVLKSYKSALNSCYPGRAGERRQLSKKEKKKKKAKRRMVKKSKK